MSLSIDNCMTELIFLCYISKPTFVLQSLVFVSLAVQKSCHKESYFYLPFYPYLFRRVATKCLILICLSVLRCLEELQHNGSIVFLSLAIQKSCHKMSYVHLFLSPLSFSPQLFRRVAAALPGMEQKDDKNISILFCKLWFTFSCITSLDYGF